MIIYKFINDKTKSQIIKEHKLSNYGFSILYTKVPQDILLHVLNEITELTFRRGGEGGGGRNYVTVYSSAAFWSRSRTKDHSFSKK